MLAEDGKPTEEVPSSTPPTADSNLPPVPAVESSEEAPVVPPPSTVPAPSDDIHKEEVLPTETVAVDSVVNELDNLKIFGNKSLDELHRIQSKRSHLSAGS